MSEVNGVPMPETGKMLAVKDQSTAIGGFLEWLDEKGLWLCRSATKEDTRDDDGESTGTREGDLLPVYKSKEILLAEYFNIDLKKVEKEKRALLESLQKENAPV